VRELIDQSPELDRQLGEATDPEVTKALIARRRMIRAEMSFEQAIADHERPALLSSTLSV
jgi:hypothetical protein